MRFPSLEHPIVTTHKIEYAYHMANDDSTIVFIGTVERVTTITDGGLRCAFNMPEDAIPQSALLMECKRMELVLKITCEVQTPVQPRKAQRKSKRLPAKNLKNKQEQE